MRSVGIHLISNRSVASVEQLILHFPLGAYMSDTTFGDLLNVDYPAYLSKHDLVYESPPEVPFDGIPLGDGETGALLWTSGDAVRFELGRSDLWDDGPERPFDPWGAEDEEVATALRAAGSLTLNAGLPIFDRFYLDDFQLRLQLFGATARMRTKTPLGSAEMEAFACRAAKRGEPGVLVVDYRDELTEPVSREVSLERWGTRVFGHWYRLVRRDASLGLGGTSSGVDGDVAWLSQETRSGTFAVAMCATGDATSCERVHSREVKLSTPPAESAGVTLFVAVASSEAHGDPVAAASEAVKAARKAGIEALRQRHAARWSDFWRRSFVHLPDEYVENLWYLNHYIMGSSALGHYPPHFINAIWPVNRDTRPWNHLYHWNNEELFWPGAAAGHPELADCWLRMRRAQLEQGAESAKRKFGAPGAWFNDVFDRRGYQTEGPPNITPGLQVALDAFRTWRHIGDEEYLHDVAWPLVRELTEFGISRLEEGDGGVLHTIPSHPYEHAAHYEVRDCLSDIAHLRSLLPRAAEMATAAGDETFAARCRDAAMRLVEPELIPIPDHYLTDDGEFAIGWSKARKPVSESIVSAGRRVDDDIPVYFRANMVGIGSEALFPNMNESLVYPSNAFGLADRGSELFRAMQNTALVHYADGVEGGESGVMGWSVAQIVFARLGMRDELTDSLDRHVRSHQHFPNGMWNYHYGWDAQTMSFDAADDVYDMENPDDKFTFPCRAHTHFGLEPGAILQTTVNEMLLQSYDGSIRLAPAVPKEWGGAFVLWAQGGFRVDAEIRSGKLVRAAIISVRGESCRIVPDSTVDTCEGWDILRADGASVDVKREGEALVLNTEADATYRLLRTGETWAAPVPMAGVPNERAKSKEGRNLGLPRMW